MRIVFVQAGLGAGGAEKVVSLLARRRAELGDEVRVLAFGPRSGKSYFAYPPEVNIETLGADSSHPAFRIVGRVRWLRRRLAGLRPDLIVSFLTKTNVLVLLASRGLGIPVVVSERNNPTRQSAHPLWHPLSLLLGRFASRLVMQTEQAREMLPPGLRKKAAVIPNPCTLPATPHESAGHGTRIVAVGRLDQQKGFDLLLAAFQKVVAGAYAATLTIFGEGSARAALEEQAQTLGIADRVRLPGLTTSPGEWIGAADIFVLSSRFEGFPNVLVEAMAAGLPAVAFDCPWGPSSIITDERDGLLVPPEDVDGLATALQRLLDDTNLRTALAAQAPRAAERFDLPRVLGEWDAVFEQAARGRTSR